MRSLTTSISSLGTKGAGTRETAISRAYAGFAIGTLSQQFYVFKCMARDLAAMPTGSREAVCAPSDIG